MPKPVREIVDMLEAMLVEARAGYITDLFMLCRGPGGEYADEYKTNDVDDMLYELGSVILRERAADPTGAPH